MKAITYINTKTTIPRWNPNLHLQVTRGYAIETPTHFVHYYGEEKPFYAISVGLTAIEKKDPAINLETWVINTFGGIDIKPMILNAGQIIEGVWRPGLHRESDTGQALSISTSDKRNLENAISLLIERLEEIFLYIYPDTDGLKAYGHKTRELLILACTEVENIWKHYMNKAAGAVAGKRYSTNDYVKLADKLHLKDFQFKLETYSTIPPIRPFKKWDISAPSASIDWYEAYNKTKHDRDAHFSEATLWHCIQAVVATLVLYSVRFSPHPLSHQRNKFSALYNEHFYGELINPAPATFYVTDLDLPGTIRPDLFIFDSVNNGYNKPFNINPLIL